MDGAALLEAFRFAARDMGLTVVEVTDWQYCIYAEESRQSKALDVSAPPGAAFVALGFEAGHWREIDVPNALTLLGRLVKALREA